MRLVFNVALFVPEDALHSTASAQMSHNAQMCRAFPLHNRHVLFSVFPLVLNALEVSAPPRTNTNVCPTTFVVKLCMNGGQMERFDSFIQGFFVWERETIVPLVNR